MRQRKHPRPNQRGGSRQTTVAKKSSGSPVVYRRQKLTRLTLGVIALMLISFLGMSYTNKVDGWRPAPTKPKNPTTTTTSTTLPAHKAN